MADYYSILNKTISGLDKNTPDVRQAVYAKARTAIENQLRRMDPPPGEDAIALQLKMLEEAIVVIDAEHVAAETQPTPPPTPVETSVMPEPPTVDQIAPEPGSVSPEPPVAPAPAPEPSISASMTPAPPVHEPVLKEPTPPTTTGGVEPAVDVGTPPPVQSKISEEKTGGTGKILVPLLILLILGGVGYGVWANRSMFDPIIASVTSGSDETDTTRDETPTQPSESETNDTDVRIVEDNADKEPVRLGSNGQDEVAEPTETTQTEAETTETPLVLEQPTETPIETETEPEVEPVEEGQANTDTAQEETQPAPVNSLGEVAYLYEEGSAGSGATRASATVNWSVAQVRPTEDLPAEPVIVGKMDVPEKGLSVDVNIKRNIDPALSASHIIELTFEIPDGFSGGSIDNIARFVMKPTEEARGEPLVAVPVKVSDGYFLIALDNLDQAVEVNQQLLLTSNWIDIPISYTTGKRALLTLEKGGSGEQVFKEAFEDWKNR
ncbi:MAG: hypothetical protein AAGA53_10720 [Pseudomonadota bacterium]